MIVKPSSPLVTSTVSECKLLSCQDLLTDPYSYSRPDANIRPFCLLLLGEIGPVNVS